MQHYRPVLYDSHVREISDCCDDRPFYWCGGQSVATHASRDRQTVVVRLCVVRPYSSLFHLSYDLIMTIECGRRRHPGGFAHTAYTETATKRARLGSVRPVGPVVSDRPSFEAQWFGGDRPVPDVKFRRQAHIHTCHIRQIDSTLHSGAAWMTSCVFTRRPVDILIRHITLVCAKWKTSLKYCIEIYNENK